MKAELDYNKGNNVSNSIEGNTSAIYFFTDPSRPGLFKVGWTNDSFEKLKTQSRYGTNQFPCGIIWHLYKPIKTYGMTEKIAEKLLHNRYYNIRFGKLPNKCRPPEWFKIPNNDDVQKYIVDTSKYLEQVEEFITPYTFG